MKNELILIVDFGCQNKELISRCVRDNSIYCEVVPVTITAEEVQKKSPKGIILVGGSNEFEQPLDKGIYSLNIPVLAIGYTLKLLVTAFGGEMDDIVTKYNIGVCKTSDSLLFTDLDMKLINGYVETANGIKTLPEGFVANCHIKGNVAGMEDSFKSLYGIQIMPEFSETECGHQIITNFLYKVCNCSGDWTMKSFVENAVTQIRETVGDGKVLLGLSGGVDSSVCCSLLSKAIGKQLTCIFVDHGFMRKNEPDEVEAAFKDSNVNFVRVDAADRFIDKLKGVTDPETKRKYIGEEFIRVFEEEAKKIGKVDFLAQGTIYPDIIESGIGKGATIKSHHNVGGLPKNIDFKALIEPLRLLFKDEVRKLGKELNLPDYMVNRQPFPGPGLAVRVIGEITREKLAILRDSDAIFRSIIEETKLSSSISQYFAIITDMRSVGVSSDNRTYDYTVVLRAIITTDFMTAKFAHIPYEILEHISSRIVNEVKGVNRVCYDITRKPPATIEWQ